MVQFFHDRLLKDDDEAFGVWRMEHYREHLQFVQIGLAQPVVVDIPNYDIVTWSWKESVVKTWLDAHENIHNVLRNFTNVTGVDLSVVDLTDTVSWYEWHDIHAYEHGLIRQALGINV